MHSNEILIHNFYQAFQKGNYHAMQQAYHPEASFSDPVFQHLTGEEVKAMWQMLITSAKDLEITYERVKADDLNGQCHWEARYTFSATGRKVHNEIDMSMQFRDGKILHHNDHFVFWRWSRMALGTPGLLLGWTPYLLSAVRKKARGSLEKYIEKSRQRPGNPSIL